MPKFPLLQQLKTRQAVPVLVWLNIALGFLRLVESPNRYHSASYYAAKQALSSLPFPAIRAWGIIFMVVGVLLWAHFRYGQDRHSRVAMLGLRSVAFIGSFVWLLWGTLSLYSAYYTGNSSYAGGVLYATIAGVHWLVVRRGY